MLKTSDAFDSTILTAKVRQSGARQPSWVLLGSIWGSRGAPLRAQLWTFVQVWFQGGFQGGFGVHFWMLLEVILDGFLKFSESVLGVILEPAV